jgi:hypothetical protein
MDNSYNPDRISLLSVKNTIIANNNLPIVK